MENMDEMKGISGWKTLFNDRERQEIEFARLYEKKFAHGTDGHNAKMIMAKFAKIMEYLTWVAENSSDEDGFEAIQRFLIGG